MVILRLYFRGRLAREAKYLDQTLQLVWELESKRIGLRAAPYRCMVRGAVQAPLPRGRDLPILNRQGIRRAFGSRSDGRSGFARYTPALLFHDYADRCIAVYPALGRRTSRGLSPKGEACRPEGRRCAKGSPTHTSTHCRR
jgi:hypothetical protein